MSDQAKVDVLGIIGAEIDRAGNEALPVVRALIAARDAVASLLEFHKEVERIANDYIPDRDSDAPLALDEMRAALTGALAKATGETP